MERPPPFVPQTQCTIPCCSCNTELSSHKSWFAGRARVDSTGMDTAKPPSSSEQGTNLPSAETQMCCRSGNAGARTIDARRQFVVPCILCAAATASGLAPATGNVPGEAPTWIIIAPQRCAEAAAEASLRCGPARSTPRLVANAGRRHRSFHLVKTVQALIFILRCATLRPSNL